MEWSLDGNSGLQPLPFPVQWKERRCNTSLGKGGRIGFLSQVPRGLEPSLGINIRSFSSCNINWPQKSLQLSLHSRLLFCIIIELPKLFLYMFTLSSVIRNDGLFMLSCHPGSALSFYRMRWLISANRISGIFKLITVFHLSTTVWIFCFRHWNVVGHVTCHLQHHIWQAFQTGWNPADSHPFFCDALFHSQDKSQIDWASRNMLQHCYIAREEDEEHNPKPSCGPCTNSGVLQKFCKAR